MFFCAYIVWDVSMNLKRGSSIQFVFHLSTVTLKLVIVGCLLIPCIPLLVLPQMGSYHVIAMELEPWRSNILTAPGIVLQRLQLNVTK